MLLYKSLNLKNMHQNMKLKIYSKLSLHSQLRSAMLNMCAYSEIRRMFQTMHVMSTNAVHNSVKSVDPLTFEVKDQATVSLTYRRS